MRKRMHKKGIYKWILFLIILARLPTTLIWADGGYFSRSESVALSADQRAIIIKNGNEISMTFSTGYTGEGEDFGWIIPTPVPPTIEDVSETAEEGERAFEILDEYTAPVITHKGGGGCFASGTEVLTDFGLCAIEKVEAGTKVYVHDFATGEWILKNVHERFSHQYEGDMVTIQIDQSMIQATGNHPFYVLRGEELPSRPLPQDIPKEEQIMTGHGRWVEARALRKGDVLKNKDDGDLIVTTISIQYEKIKVYNLEVEGYHNYAIHQNGLLVHNKGKGKGYEKESKSLVMVYGTVTLDHYEVNILGAADATALLGWLKENGYQVNPEAQDVLNTYIDKNWAFVAVKLNPIERRHYENEFLPPLTIQFQYDQLIFPFHISSVSTNETAKITLYVISESTVTSSNFPTKILKYNRRLLISWDPQRYIEACIQKTIGSECQVLAVVWSGFHMGGIIDELIKSPFPLNKIVYLTRLESRIDPGAITEDIKFNFNQEPRQFGVHIEVSTNLEVIAGYGIVFLPIFLIFLVWLIRMFVRRHRQRIDR